MTKKNWLTFIDSVQHNNELIIQSQVPIGYGIYHIREIEKLKQKIEDLIGEEK